MKAIILFLIAILITCCHGEFPNDFEAIDPEPSTDTDDRDEPNETGSDSDSPADTDVDTDADTDSDSDEDSGTDGDTDVDGDADIDTDSDSEGEGDTDTQTGEDTQIATDSETETNTEETPCEKAARNDPAIVCCPADPPTDCRDTSWDWSPYDKEFGCCTADLSQFVDCQNWSLGQEVCAGVCGFFPNTGGLNSSLGCLPKAGNSCQNPLIIDTQTTTWSGRWIDFGNTFVPSNDCGKGDLDIWFRVFIEADQRVEIQETTNSKVVLRLLKSCADSKCVGFSQQKPETMVLRNSTPKDHYSLLVVTRRDLSTKLALKFTR